MLHLHGLLRTSVMLGVVAILWAIDFYEGRSPRSAWLSFEMWLLLGVLEGLFQFAIEKRRPNSLNVQRSPMLRFIRQLKVSILTIPALVVVAYTPSGWLQQNVLLSLFEVLVFLIVLSIPIYNLAYKLELRLTRS